MPVEYEIDKTLGIKDREDVLKMGIDKYNAECRGIVMRYSKEWETTVTRMGRWIDFENDYKTLNTSFMESVWWVFKQLYDKGQVYRGFKVMPFSTGCCTPLSNFEAKQNYENVNDPAVTVSFPLESDPEVSFLAWTTTPWTLPSNLALCVHPEFEYVQIKDGESGAQYILHKNLLNAIYKDPKKAKYTVVKSFKGKELAGMRYKPLFDYYSSRKERSFKVLCDTYVTDQSGTGIVHQAPGFGEDDYRVCVDNGIIEKDEEVPCPVSEAGKFLPIVKDFAGQYVKEADKEIMKHLKNIGRLIKQGTINHSYPFCWRSDTPLIYKAVPSWFVRVENIADKLLKNNAESYWVPAFVQENRFANWLRDCRDWAISRNRFWGTPMPIWTNEDFTEFVCVGSIAELEKLTGKTGITDLHRDHIDGLTIPSKKKDGSVLRRIDEVFDCWFESGSMPYAQQHYPFENKERFEKTFPADFIAEGLDQTRGWFYTLLVLSTHLFDKPPFKNLIVNGLVLASDGKKMSKRLKNYPEPSLILNSFGADALRLYLINSPVVKAESLKFKEEGVRDILKDVFTPLVNSYKFFVYGAVLLKKEEGKTFTYSPKEVKLSDNTMDRWILASCQSLVKFVREEMAGYRLYTVVPRLLKLIEDLTNWYIRFNRRRFKGENGVEDTVFALNTLFEVLYTLVRALSPFTPFLCENMYQGLKKYMVDQDKTVDARSIHFLDFPQVREEYFDPVIERVVSRLQSVVVLGRTIRERNLVSLRFPLKNLTVIHNDPEYVSDLKSVELYLIDELNVRNLELTSDEEKYNVSYKVFPDFKNIGAKFREKVPKIKQALSNLTSADLKSIAQTKAVVLKDLDVTLSEEEIKVSRFVEPKDGSKVVPAYENELVVLLDLEQDDKLRTEGLAREWVNRVQRLRKKAGLNPTDRVNLYYRFVEDLDNQLDLMLKSQTQFLQESLKDLPIPADKFPAGTKPLLEQEDEVRLNCCSDLILVDSRINPCAFHHEKINSEALDLYFFEDFFDVGLPVLSTFLGLPRPRFTTGGA